MVLDEILGKFFFWNGQKNDKSLVDEFLGKMTGYRFSWICVKSFLTSYELLKRKNSSHSFL